MCPPGFGSSAICRPRLWLSGLRDHPSGPRPGASESPRAWPVPGLLAHVLVAKYCDHLPLFTGRAKSFAPRPRRRDRTGSTLSNWVGRRLLVAGAAAGTASQRTCLDQPSCFADDTRGSRCSIPAVGPQPRTGRLWGLCGRRRSTLVRARNRRPPSTSTVLIARQRRPAAHLQDFPWRTAKSTAMLGFERLTGSGDIVTGRRAWAPRTTQIL